MKTKSTSTSTMLSLVKANLSGWYAILALSFFSVFSSGCDERIVVCPAEEYECTEVVSAENVACGYGAFENIWFKTENGKYLQPWENLTDTKTLVPGQKYKIGFRVIKRDNKYKDLITCMAALPESEAVVVACVSAASDNN